MVLSGCGGCLLLDVKEEMLTTGWGQLLFIEFWSVTLNSSSS